MRPVVFAVIVASQLFLATGVCAESFSAKVVGVSDGDTMTVLYQSQQQKIRLAMIDSPEKKQAYGTVAKKYLAHCVLGKLVVIEIQGKDRYGRAIANVSLDGRLMNLDMVSQGLAWCYRKYSNDPTIIAAEQEAREKKRGLWQDPAPIPPWEFRKTQHRK